MFLVDTNVVSETRRPRPHPRLMAWIASVPAEHLHLAVVTIGELQAGVEKIRETDALKASVLERWVDAVALSFNIIDMDIRAFRCWARLLRAHSHHLVEDAMIAATAEVHGLQIVSRNVRDFERFGITVLNPFEGT